MDYYIKYLKYKLKYINLSNQIGGNEHAAKLFFIRALEKDNGYITSILMNDLNLNLDKLKCPLSGNLEHNQKHSHITYNKSNPSLPLCENERIRPEQYEAIFNKIYKRINNNSTEVYYIIKSYINNTFGKPSSLENYGRYLNAIEKYNLLKKNDPTTKDINLINGLLELEEFISKNKDRIKILEDIENKGKPPPDLNIGKDDVKIILKNKNLTIYYPLTEAGSVYYGKDTIWCTAFLRESMFHFYNDKGPLYIIQSNTYPLLKFQLHKEYNQMMDGDDKDAPTTKILKAFNNDKDLSDWFDKMELNSTLDDRKK
jgi:hypothetical protein